MPNTAFVASAGRMMAWIEEICAQGVRTPGSAPDRWTEDFVEQHFTRIGLADVHREDVPLPKWDPGTWSLDVAGERFACFPCPHSAPCPDGIEAPLSRDDLEGNIALETVTLNSWPQSFVRDQLAIDHHDPDGEFDTLVQVLPFGRQMQAVLEPAIEAGAVAWVGVFDAPWDTCDYYVPYDGVQREIPGVWVSKSSGERIDALLPATAKLVVDSTRTTATTHNIIGTLSGASDEWIIIASHHDGPWVSAVEDASGVAMVLAQAEYWAQVPEAERPHNLMFLVTSGHMVHGSGTAAFIAAHTDWLSNVVLEMHLEHAAQECRGEDGQLVPTGEPEAGWWFTTRSDHLLASVKDALVAENVKRSLIMPPDVFGPHPTTDGGFFHMEGVPLVNFLAAPMYLFDSQDTPDKIHVPSLEPITRAAIRIIDATRGVTAAQMRA